MSLNTATGTDQGAKWRDTLEPHLEEINERQPDILCLQEVDRNTARSSFIDQFELLKRSTHLKYGVFAGVAYPTWPQVGQYGDAVLSRWPAITSAPFYSEWKGNLTPLPTLDVVIYGRRLRILSVHTGMARGYSGSEAEQQPLKTFSDAKPILGAPTTNALMAGDFNMDINERPLQFLRQLMSWRDFDKSEPLSDGSSTRDPLDPDLGIDHVLFKGRDVSRPHYERWDNFRQQHRTGTWFTDHPILTFTFDVEPPMEPAFRVVSDYVAQHSTEFSGGWATMKWGLEPDSREVVFFKPGVAEFRDLEPRDIQLTDVRRRFTSAHDWATSQGYETAFPNFHNSGGRRYGTWLVKRGSASERKDVSIADLGLPPGLDNVDFERWLIACDD